MGRGFAILVLLGLAGGCSASGAGADDAGSVAAAVAALVGPTVPGACVDSRTSGESLQIFKTMALAPDPARRPLQWHAPATLGSGGRFSAGQLINAEFADEHSVIPEPQQASAPLPVLDQAQLTAYAIQLSSAPVSRHVVVRLPPRSAARTGWWLANRFSSSCAQRFTLTDPVIARDIAFVSVTSGHWGTTYAVRREQGAWRPVAQWSNWLY